MSWECEPCHVIATGEGHAVHFYTGSRGKCETCGQVGDCADCRCPGDWGKARSERRVAAVSPRPSDEGAQRDE